MSIFDDKTPWTDGYGERGKRIKEFEAERDAQNAVEKRTLAGRNHLIAENARLSAQASHCDEFREKLAAATKIIRQALTSLPVGNLRTHTPESIPERINDIIKECAALSAENERLTDERSALRIAFADASHSDCSIGAERFLKDGWLCANHKEELYKLRAAIDARL